MTDSRTALVDLKPCPFCGGPAEINYDFPEEAWQVPVVCQFCGAAVGADTEELAIAAWNRREAADALQGGGWREIASSPKDGTRVLVFSAVDGVNSSHWDGGMWQGLPWRPVRNPDYNLSRPTHWQPLPSPPAPTTAAGVES
jgi:Lar family restriction alleviation protein